MIKRYLLCSQWSLDVDYDKDTASRIRKQLTTWCKLPEIINTRIKDVTVTRRVVAETWRDAFRVGRIGKSASVSDYYVEVDMDELTTAQITVIEGFFVGFLSGRDSAKLF
jgi:hypothetical protein